MLIFVVVLCACHIWVLACVQLNVPARLRRRLGGCPNPSVKRRIAILTVIELRSPQVLLRG
jgi:hypothetical protein